jgi:hypothetical protein
LQTILQARIGVVNPNDYSVSLSVGATGTSRQYQWQRSSTSPTTFTNIPAANSATYSIAAAVPPHSGNYRCIVTNDCPSAVTSTVAAVVVAPDVIPPHVLSAIARAHQGATMDTVVVTVDKALNPAGANTAGNYTITRSGGGSPTVANAALAQGTNVTLKLNGGLTFGVLYHINFLAGVTDNAFTPNRISPNSTHILEQSVFLTYSNAWSYDETQVATNSATAAMADGYWTNTPAWYAAGFTPVGWSNGPGILALEPDAAVIAIAPAPFLTRLTQPTHTIYFRTTATYTGPTANVGLVADHFIDDGLLCCLNGAELFRFKLPGFGVITHTSTASGGVEAINAATNLGCVALGANNLVACSLHTMGPASSDAVFGLELAATFPCQIITGTVLSVRREGNQMVISWDPPLGVLQETTVLSPTPSWIDSPVQANPQTNTITGRMKFFSARE